MGVIGQPRGDDGDVVQVEHFDYESVDLGLGWSQPETNSEEKEQLAIEAIRILARWVWQRGMKNPEGLMIRAAILCWILLPNLESITLTELSHRFNKDKQSFGRWVDQFKRAFPNIRTPNMRQ